MPRFFVTQKGIIAGFFCLFFLFIAYLPTFNAPFVWDDEVMVVGNPLIRSPVHIPQIFEASAFGHAASAQDFFRPIQTLSYILDYQLFGLDASGFHTMSWLYFALSCALLFYFLRLLPYPTVGDVSTLTPSGFSRYTCLAITLLFAMHPLNIEVVTYISGRGDVLFLVFALLALCGVVHASKGRTWAILLVWISTLLAILSKENAIALPFVMSLLWIVLPKGPQNWRYWTAALPTLVGNLVYIGYRIMALGDPHSMPLSPISFASFYERVLTLPYILWTYFRLTFLPYPLHMDYLHVVTDILNPYLWIGLPLLMLVLAILWRWVRSPMYLFLLAWIGFGLGPVLQVIPLTATVREHWFSFSLIATLTLIVAGLSHRFRNTPKWLVHACFGVAVVTLMSLTYIRNLDWTDPMRLYSHDVEIEPRSFLLHNNLGVLHYRNQNFSEAKKSFQKSVLVTPGNNGYGTALNNLGVIAEHENNRSLALDYYRRSIMGSHYELAYANAMRLLLMDNQWKTALPLAEDALQKYPYHQSLLRYAAIIYSQMGHHDKSDAILKRLKQLYPE